MPPFPYSCCLLPLVEQEAEAPRPKLFFLPLHFIRWVRCGSSLCSYTCVTPYVFIWCSICVMCYFRFPWYHPGPFILRAWFDFIAFFVFLLTSSNFLYIPKGSSLHFLKIPLGLDFLLALKTSLNVSHFAICVGAFCAKDMILYIKKNCLLIFILQMGWGLKILR